ncbi:hypothetical protein [Streptomyces parvulus]|uniref:hypothetical protein n=1 Tax=Streptomyces parvulus TaxID=146923 RepID=UPI003434F37A
MLREATARARIPFPAAVLLALLLFAPAASFAFAHTSRDAMANAHPGITLSGTASHEERATCHDHGRSGNPHGPAPLRDRHRTTGAPQSEALAGPLARPRPAVPPVTAAPGRGADGGSRPPTDRSPAALQVFRC